MTNELKLLISKGRIEQAIEKMLKINLKEQHINEITILSSWYQRTVKNENLGLSKKNEDYQVITKSLLSLIDEIDNEKKEDILQSSKEDKSAGSITKVTGDGNITIIDSKVSGGLNKN